jgi:hypothetical protein
VHGVQIALRNALTKGRERKCGHLAIGYWLSAIANGLLGYRLVIALLIGYWVIEVIELLGYWAIGLLMSPRLQRHLTRQQRLANHESSIINRQSSINHQ